MHLLHQLLAPPTPPGEKVGNWWGIWHEIRARGVRKLSGVSKRLIGVKGHDYCHVAFWFKYGEREDSCHWSMRLHRLIQFQPSDNDPRTEREILISRIGIIRRENSTWQLSHTANTIENGKLQRLVPKLFSWLHRGWQYLQGRVGEESALLQTKEWNGAIYNFCLITRWLIPLCRCCLLIRELWMMSLYIYVRMKETTQRWIEINFDKNCILRNIHTHVHCFCVKVITLLCFIGSSQFLYHKKANVFRFLLVPKT